MEQQRLFLHVGLAKTGTTYLQSLLAESRPRLRDAGLIYPFVRPEAMFHAAAEVRDDLARWGLSPALVQGTWEALLDKARDFGGTTIISHELLAGADAHQVAGALARADGFELNVVVTARDLARQVPAHWQEAVKNGHTFSFADFTREVVGEESDAPDSCFHLEQDLLGVLDRWCDHLSPEQVHVVTCPPAGADPDELWHRFAQATGVPTGVVDRVTPVRSNASLGLAEVHLLRAVNRELGGRLGQPAYAHVAKRLFAQRILSQVASPAAVCPESLRSLLTTRAQQVTTELQRRGYVVHGDLEDLTPSVFSSADPDAFTEHLPAAPSTIAALLCSVADLRVTAPALSAGSR